MLKQLIYTVPKGYVRVTLHTSNDHTSEISMQLVDKDDEVLSNVLFLWFSRT